ncbi:MAG: hypothetical protein QOC96_1146 [Acidobacteriota bacterium]|jgi:hypothetical protein|nr:hypothetical protein [Acidobacteriota bacterium]
MKRKLYIALAASVVLTAVALLSNWNVSRADQPGKFTLRGDFEVTIVEGPSAQSGPVTIAGTMTLAVSSSGSFTGTLTPFDGQASVVFGNLAVTNPRSIPVVGQLNDRAYNLTLELGNNRFISGIGTAQNVVSKRGDMVGLLVGPAVGPKLGDRGDWASGTTQDMIQITTGTSYQGPVVITWRVFARDEVAN